MRRSRTLIWNAVGCLGVTAVSDPVRENNCVKTKKGEKEVKKRNLVANNFMINNSNNSVLPSGLECLQRNTPCFLGAPQCNLPPLKSLGKRVFDIYVQGERKEQNFDIRKAAGGKSYTAVKRQYIVPVTRNFLDIHLFWAGKGTCCIPTQGYYGPAISTLSATPNFTPTVRNAA